MTQNAVAYLCEMAPMAKLNCAPFLKIYVLYTAVTYAENFHGGIHSVAFGVCCLWRHNLTSQSCFQNNVLAKFVDIICIFLYTHYPYFMCHCTEYKLSALQVRLSVENKHNATTQLFLTAKISGRALIQRSKTHSSKRQCNLQLQNEAALMSCWIRAVEHRKSAAALGGVHAGVHNRVLLN